MVLIPLLGDAVSLPVSLSAWLPGSAAIIATQLTTPYVRIVPAAGDKQLTGNSEQSGHTHTHI